MLETTDSALLVSLLPAVDVTPCVPQGRQPPRCLLQPCNPAKDEDVHFTADGV